MAKRKKTRAKPKKGPKKEALPVKKVRKKPKRKVVPEAVKKEDFVLIDFTGVVKETNEVFDTTIEKVAKEAGIHKEGAAYEPRLAVVGRGWVLKGMDERLIGLKVGKETKFTLNPEEGFGPRDPKKIEVVPYRLLRAEKIVPQPGITVKFRGKDAIIRSVSGGRVTLDYNPPLAGKNIIYDVEVKRILKNDTEKMAALIHRWFPSVEAEKFNVKIAKNRVQIIVPKEAFYVEGVQVIKRGIFKDMEVYFPKISQVDFVESYVREAA